MLVREAEAEADPSETEIEVEKQVQMQRTKIEMQMFKTRRQTDRLLRPVRLAAWRADAR